MILKITKMQSKINKINKKIIFNNKKTKNINKKFNKRTETLKSIMKYKLCISYSHKKINKNSRSSIMLLTKTRIRSKERV